MVGPRGGRCWATGTNRAAYCVATRLAGAFGIPCLCPARRLMILLRAPQTGLLAHDTPGSFAALMDLYERNYINLRRLLPIMPPASTVRISRVAGAWICTLRIIGRSRYTSDLILTYQFRQNDGVVTAEPNLHIRSITMHGWPR